MSLSCLVNISSGLDFMYTYTHCSPPKGGEHCTIILYQVNIKNNVQPKCIHALSELSCGESCSALRILLLQTCCKSPSVMVRS